MKAAPTALFLSLAASGALAHMSIWTESMYGVGEGFDTSSGDPVAPLGPDWDSQDEWWFRGPTARSLSPAARGSNAVTQLPAGGSVTFEIACNVAWTSFGCCEWQVAYYNATALDACPGNTGAYHSGDPAADTIDDSLLSGCALGIADVDDINDVTMDNLAIFSVNHECVKQKDTTFEIPAQMPACTGDKCICGWFWLANNGTANFYMTAFDCAVTGASANAPAIAAPVDPEYCPDDEFAAGSCSRPAGAKRPLYAYNEPTNVVWHGNDARPGYHASWGFPNNGAQNDIFVTANVTSSANATSSAVSATSSVVSSTAVSSSVAASSSSSSSSSASSSASSSSTSTTAAPTSTGLTPAQAAAAAWTSRSLASAASSSSKAAASSSKSAASAASAAAKSSSSAAAAFSRAAASAASSKSAASASSSKSAAKASSEAAKASSEASKSSSKAAAAASKAAAKVHAAEAAGAKNADRIKLAKLASATTSAPANAYTPHGGAAAAAAAWSSKIAASSSAKSASASASSRAAWRASAASKAAADRSSKREAASSRSAAVAAASSAAAAELDGAFKPNTQNLKLAVLGSIVNDDDE